MEKQSEIVLFGTWASSYCTRVALALKLKGIPYEYVEEGLTNKSELLLQYNPVHKKVPVLVHKGKPIAESLVILEYIDEHWDTSPKLLPEDPYERAKARFWANFYDHKLLPSSFPVIKLKGKEQEKAIEDFSELLKVFEGGLEKDFPGLFQFSDRETLGYLDIVVGANACNYKAFDEAVAVIVNPEKHHGFVSWVTALKDCPLMKETLPPHDKLVSKMREKYFQSPQVMPSTLSIMLKGKEQEKAIEEYSELFRVFGEGIEKDFPQRSPFFNGDTLGFLDIVVGSNACNYNAFHEAVGTSADLEKQHPALFSWVTALTDYPLMKVTLPPHHKLVARIRTKFSLSPKV
ncbi:hypothetical protein F0562_033772 [Nyssa sinensis]|uniref:glutathione transferase n=1 Tax=Nyssa sinensis TaxID=561372 RepID=A0A5J5AGT6_9ASTE|nr:hypothetical protein F0562_033772 [Nyssa sinensis]